MFTLHVICYNVDEITKGGAARQYQDYQLSRSAVARTRGESNGSRVICDFQKEKE